MSLLSPVVVEIGDPRRLAKKVLVRAIGRIRALMVLALSERDVTMCQNVSELHFLLNMCKSEASSAHDCRYMF